MAWDICTKADRSCDGAADLSWWRSCANDCFALVAFRQFPVLWLPMFADSAESPAAWNSCQWRPFSRQSLKPTPMPELIFATYCQIDFILGGKSIRLRLVSNIHLWYKSIMDSVNNGWAVTLGYLCKLLTKPIAICWFSISWWISVKCFIWR